MLVEDTSMLELEIAFAAALVADFIKINDHEQSGDHLL